jgi:transposase
MARRIFSRELKVEAVRLVGERGVSVAQAARDLDIHENMLRRWAKGTDRRPGASVSGHGQSKPEQLEIERLRREVAKLRAEQRFNQALFDYNRACIGKVFDPDQLATVKQTLSCH